MSILDRYLLRLTIPPFLIALGVLTFVLAIEPTLDEAKSLLAKGVSVPTAALLLSFMVPSALSLTIPMALLTGLLMALGRLSGDRESVALLACGVSPWRLLRPVLLMGVLVAGFDMFILMRATPAANQAFRDVTYGILTQQTSAEIHPRVFFERFPGKVLYIRDLTPDGRWSGVLLADTTNPSRPSVTLAEVGTLLLDPERRLVRLNLSNSRTYTPGKSDDRVYTRSEFPDDLSIDVPAESVFGSGKSIPGLHERSRDDLLADIQAKRANGDPAHAEIIQLQQIYSFPVACLVFAIIGLGLGLNTRKEGRLAGLTLGLAVIMVYYAVMGLAEAWTKSAARTGGPVELIATWARWIPNIALGVIGLVAFWRLTRPNGLNLPIRLPQWFLDWRARATTRRRPSAGLAFSLPSWLPAPRLLDRYVTNQFARAAAIAFLGLLSLYYIGAYVDLADKLKRPGDGWIFLSFLINSTPQFIIFVIPITMLVAVLGTIGGLTRTGELIVMRACGVSLYRAAVPLLVAAAVGSGVLFLVEERVLGEANRTATTLRDQFRDHPGPKIDVMSGSQHTWLVGDDGRIYHYALFTAADPANGGRPAIRDLSIFEVQSNPYRLQSHLYAARAAFDGSMWRLDAGWTQQMSADALDRHDFQTETRALPSLTEFQRASRDPETMTYFAARDYVGRLAASGLNVTEERVNLQRRLAFPCVTIVMTLLAIPFGVTIGRKGALYGIGLATILAASYFLLMTIFVAFGSAGLLPPVLAAWAANVLFGAAAIYMILTVRT